MEHRLVHDTSIHRWKHIWLRCQFGTSDSIYTALLTDVPNALGVLTLSTTLLNAKAPPSDPTYGKWGPTPLIAALEHEQFANAMQLLKWGAYVQPRTPAEQVLEPLFLFFCSERGKTCSHFLVLFFVFLYSGIFVAIHAFATGRALILSTGLAK